MIAHQPERNLLVSASDLYKVEFSPTCSLEGFARADLIHLIHQLTDFLYNYFFILVNPVIPVNFPCSKLEVFPK